MHELCLDSLWMKIPQHYLSVFSTYHQKVANCRNSIVTTLYKLRLDSPSLSMKILLGLRVHQPTSRQLMATIVKFKAKNFDIHIYRITLNVTALTQLVSHS